MSIVCVKCKKDLIKKYDTNPYYYLGCPICNIVLYIKNNIIYYLWLNKNNRSDYNYKFCFDEYNKSIFIFSENRRDKIFINNKIDYFINLDVNAQFEYIIKLIDNLIFS